MSQIRDPAYITEQGKTMMTAGGDVLYTKAVLYGQDISHLHDDQIQALTSIGNPLKEVPIGVSDKQNTDKGTTVVLEATFQNDNLKADLPYTAVGFYGKRGNDNEKLIIVAVANAGAYLAATRPDGVATDALDLKVAIAIGDATNVTAVVDPAASVTPATLNGAINETKQVLTALIDTKASQSNLDQTNAEVAKKADSEAVNSQLATKANTTDIDKQVKTLNDAINTKADKATVDAEISKIDFTPYAKTADVSEQIKAVSDEIATKVGADYSYSKAQLDEKLLALSTDTNGKVSADQVTALIADKANKADVDKSFKAVNDSLATKADQATTYSKTDVDKLLSAKDDTTDVDAKIKTVTDLANTKADSNDVYTKKDVDDALSTRDSNITNAANLAKQAQDTANTKANAIDLSALQNSAMQVIDGNSGDDILSFRDEKIRCYNNAQNVQNLPDMSNKTWFYVITHTKNGWGSVTVISQDNCYWQNVLNSPNWSGWVKHATNVDITGLQNQINTKLNKTDTVNVVNSYDVNNNQNGGLNKWPVTQAWYVDQTALRPFADQINQLKGRRTVDAPDFNSLTDSGSYYISNPSKGENYPVYSWGNMLVSNGADHRTSQMYFPDDGSALYMRELDETTWHDWIQLATTSQVNYAKSTANWDNINGRPQDQINRINVDGPLFKHLTQFNNWGDLFDGYSVNGINATNGSRLVAFRDDTNGSNTVGSNGAGIGFGGSDTKGVLSVAYGSHQARITGGNGTGPTWNEDIAWKSDVSDLRNQVQQLRENQFETQTFTDANAAANWEAQRPGHRLAIIQS